MRGFTLLEAMVAVSILAISVAAPMYAASRALVAAENANNRLSASYLAQEGPEYIRLIRDNEFIAVNETVNINSAWSNFMGKVNACVTGTCKVTPWSYTATPASCTLAPVNTCLVYRRDGTTPTIFSRTVKVTEIVPGKQAVVTTEVSWPFRGTTYRLTVVGQLSAWK